MYTEYCGGECYGCGEEPPPCEDLAALHRYIEKLQEEAKVSAEEMQGMEARLGDD